MDNRDADKRYNKLSADELQLMLSNLDLDSYMAGIGIDCLEQ